MATKLFDMAVKTGEYQKDGQNKGRYQRIGAVMQSDDGGQFALLDVGVNLAGLLIQQNAMNQEKGKNPSSSLMCSMFDGNSQGGQPAPAQQQAPQTQQQYQQPNGQPMNPQQVQQQMQQQGQNFQQQTPQFDGSEAPF